MTTPTRSANFGWYAAITSLALLIIGPLTHKFGLAPFFVGFILLSIAVLLALIVVIMGALSLRASANPANRQKLRVASVLALPALVMTAVILGGGRGAVLTHDISTDTANPPQFVAAISQRGINSNPLDYSAEEATLQQQGYPDIKPIVSTLDSKAAFARAIQLVEASGWEIYRRDENAGVIEAVASTFWFGFKDDIIVRITPATNGSTIDIRSVSRVGKGDMGTNAKRVRLFIEQFTAS